MSHQTSALSPTGTPLKDQTVGEIVARTPSQARVFQAFGIDFCCQGGRTLAEACGRKGVSLESVTEQPEADEGDLHRHIHLESSVLFPQAMEMSRAAAR